MAITEYADYDGLGLAELVRNKDVKPSELVEEAIGRAEKLNPRLNFVVFRDYERARATAKGELPKGVFSGVPFFLKDIFATAEGIPTRLGSRFMPAVPAPHDSLLTTRYKAAGLVILGKTNVSEFGLVPTTESRLYGPARNPWHLDHSPGGSSGGSAAAVAARIVPLAHANDGGGSIRTPASCCGLVGLKPTRARMSYAPDFGDMLDGLANDHVVSRSVRDSAAALDATAGCIEGDPYWAPDPPHSYLAAMAAKPKRLRIAFSTKGTDGRPLHPDCVEAIEHAARLCESLGHIVEEATPDLNQTTLIPAFMAFWASHLAAGIDHIAQLTGQTPSDDKFEGLTWGLYETGKRITASQYLLAKGAMQVAGRNAAAFHEHYDVWLSSTLGSPPVRLGTFDLDERDPQKAFAPLIDYVQYTAMQNVTGQPAINLPLHWNAAGLPIGAHFVGRYGDETTLLQLAAQLEQAAPWAQRRPNLES
ncbi:amidase [Paraburkholderia caffeinilytica]|uniref:amidase n=1 Tax=Paraburkholderia caffeinilytica TaxID=1761016 RepID=UPI0038BA85DE